MRLAVLISLGLVVSCSSKGDDDDDDDDDASAEGDDTGGSIFPDDSGSSDDGCPDEVPEEYQYLWDCENNSCDGYLVYHHAVGESTESDITAVEEWFVFSGGGEWCKDTFEITGDVSQINPETYSCSQCEEIFEVNWTLTESNCGWSWGTTFNDEDNDNQKYYGFLMFDTHNAFGDRNPDDAMLVIGAPVNLSKSTYSLLSDYARGTATPTGSNDGPPEDYVWANTGTCYTMSR